MSVAAVGPRFCEDLEPNIRNIHVSNESAFRPSPSCLVCVRCPKKLAPGREQAQVSRLVSACNSEVLTLVLSIRSQTTGNSLH